MSVREITASSELVQLIQSQQTVVIDFYATWCGPCKVIAPQFAELAAQYPDVVFVKVDVDRHKDLAQRHGIEAMPTLQVYSQGSQVQSVRGGDLGAVRSAIEFARRSAQMPVGDSDAVVQSIFELAWVVEDSSDDVPLKTNAFFSALEREPQAKTFGLAMLPAFFSGAIPQDVLQVALSVMLQASDPLAVHNVKTLILNLCSFAVDHVSFMDPSRPEGKQEVVRLLSAVLGCQAALDYIVTTPRFTGAETADSGRRMQLFTILGALTGHGLWGNRFSKHEQILATMKMFPSEGGRLDRQKEEEGRREIQSHLGSSHDQAFQIVRLLLRATPQRQATLNWLAKFLRLNMAYKKEMHNDANLSTRFALANVANVLVSLALPIVESSDFPASIPPFYTDSTAALIDFSDAERVQLESSEDAESSSAGSPTKGSNFPPKVDLFYLALVAQHLHQSTVLLKWNSWEQHVRHPEVDPRQKAFIAAEMAFHRSLLTGREFAVKTLRQYNGVAKWLLSVAQCDTLGQLPSRPPTAWLRLPQHIIDDTIRSVELITRFQTEVDYYAISDIVSLMLAVMGNTAFFPKPHTHAIFPTLLVFLNQNPHFARPFQGHPWYSRCILERSVQCYIAVGKAEHERVQARYYLSMALTHYLSDRMLCDPLQDTFGDETNPLLEKFAHVVTSESSDALESILDALVKMRELEQNNSPQVLLDNDTYQQQGSSLKSSLIVFNGAIEVFGSLATMFPKGVLRHLVAQQISLMLVKSLVKLAGRNSKELKINNPGTYDFDPRRLVASVVECFTKFHGQPLFLKEVAKCGVSMDEFYYACNNVINRPLVSGVPAIALGEMMSEVQLLEASTAEEDAQWDDAPDFALCELLNVPLKNPVALPSSGQDHIIVDMESIRHHLLDEAQNPYTREKMTIDDLEAFNAKPEIEAEIAEIKQKIADWRASRQK